MIATWTVDDLHSEGEAARHECKHDENEEDDEGDREENLGDGGRCGRDPGESQEAGDQLDNEKNQCPFQHGDASDDIGERRATDEFVPKMATSRGAKNPPGEAASGGRRLWVSRG